MVNSGGAGIDGGAGSRLPTSYTENAILLLCYVMVESTDTFACVWNCPLTRADAAAVVCPEDATQNDP